MKESCLVAEKKSVRVIAEISTNHNGDLSRALALVEEAAKAGFTDVKTQAFRVRELFAPEAIAARPELLARERYELTPHWHEALRALTRGLGMRYGVTPCARSDVVGAARWADWLKVSSYSLLDRRLLRAIGAVGVPVVVSTGMATQAEVEGGLAAFRSKHSAPELTLLHCISSYPAPPHEANLRSIPFLRSRFGLDCGWSDHTVSPLVVGRALSVYQADMLELHWDLDDGLGSEAAHSWTPKSWAEFARSRVLSDDGYYACDGKAGVKAPSVSESSERDWRADPFDGLRPLLSVRAALAPIERPG